jgi:chemotaxis protein methyltransferase CheR
MTELPSTFTKPKFNYHFKTGNNLKLSDDLFDNLRKFIYDSCGIYFQDNKKYLLESRLLKRISFLGKNSFEEYYDFLRSVGGGTQEKKYLFEAITINETFFFRNQSQLDALVLKVIPELLASKAKFGRQKIRIWSAASSSGEEAYSIGIIINDLLMPKYPGLEVEIVGTDIDHAVIETARSGIYKEYSIRNTPPYYLKKYFKNVGNVYEINRAIKSMVLFKTLNLFNDFEMKAMAGFDIIFCANVLIYFDLKAKIKVINQLYSSLNKGGYLFIGYAETLHMISKAFSLINFPRTIGYKKE